MARKAAEEQARRLAELRTTLRGLLEELGKHAPDRVAEGAWMGAPVAVRSRVGGWLAWLAGVIC